MKGRSGSGKRDFGDLDASLGKTPVGGRILQKVFGLAVFSCEQTTESCIAIGGGAPRIAICERQNEIGGLAPKSNRSRQFPFTLGCKCRQCAGQPIV
jgi:hypothetical protein